MEEAFIPRAVRCDVFDHGTMQNDSIRQRCCTVILNMTLLSQVDSE